MAMQNHCWSRNTVFYQAENCLVCLSSSIAFFAFSVPQVSHGALHQYRRQGRCPGSELHSLDSVLVYDLYAPLKGMVQISSMFLTIPLSVPGIQIFENNYCIWFLFSFNKIEWI